MALFKKRPLACFCVLFFAVSFLAGYLPVCWSVLGGILFLFLGLPVFLVPRLRHRMLGAGLAFSVVLLALCHSLVLTELPRLRALRFEGERDALCRVVETPRNSSDSSTATVQILSMDGIETGIRGELICEFGAELGVGDEILARVTVEEKVSESTFLLSSRKDSAGRLLRLTLQSPENGIIDRMSEEELTPALFLRSGGVYILSGRLRHQISTLLSRELGDGVGGLAGGFLIGDTEGLPSSVLRDFRRTGCVHLLSVSGLHIGILLGAVELLLRVLRLRKWPRMILVTLCGLVLLAMAGFSYSACRALLMLTALYLAFLLREEADSITILFGVGALIVLLSPYAVNDLGFWMSFQATLGILTLFQHWERRSLRSRREKKKSALRRLVWEPTRSLLLLTLAANLFLLPIFWVVFGEMSLTTPLANLLVSLPASVFLVGVPLYLLLRPIPLLGAGVAMGLSGLGKGMMALTRLLSRIPRSVISLRYGFCAVLIPIFVLAMAILLVIRLKRKWLLSLPPLLLVLSFLLCLGAQNLFFAEPRAMYCQRGTNTEAVAWNEGDRVVVCDLSFGGYYGAEAARALLRRSTATEVDALILTHLHEGHVTMLDLLSEEVMIRTLYLPLWEEEGTVLAFREAAELRGIRVIGFGGGESLRLFHHLVLTVERSEERGHDAFLLRMRSGEREMAYASAHLFSSAERVTPLLEDARLLIVGAHGAYDAEEREISLGEDSKRTVVFGNADFSDTLSFSGGEIEFLYPVEETYQRILSFSLS